MDPSFFLLQPEAATVEEVQEMVGQVQYFHQVSSFQQNSDFSDYNLENWTLDGWKKAA